MQEQAFNRAKTPLIATAIIGGVLTGLVALIFLVAFTVKFIKRNKKPRVKKFDIVLKKDIGQPTPREVEIIRTKFIATERARFMKLLKDEQLQAQLEAKLEREHQRELRLKRLEPEPHVDKLPGVEERESKQDIPPAEQKSVEIQTDSVESVEPPPGVTYDRHLEEPATEVKEPPKEEAPPQETAAAAAETVTETETESEESGGETSATETAPGDNAPIVVSEDNTQKVEVLPRDNGEMVVRVTRYKTVTPEVTRVESKDGSSHAVVKCPSPVTLNVKESQEGLHRLNTPMAVEVSDSQTDESLVKMISYSPIKLRVQTEDVKEPEIVLKISKDMSQTLSRASLEKSPKIKAAPASSLQSSPQESPAAAQTQPTSTPTQPPCGKQSTCCVHGQAHVHRAPGSTKAGQPKRGAVVPASRATAGIQAPDQVTASSRSVFTEHSGSTASSLSSVESFLGKARSSSSDSGSRSVFESPEERSEPVAKPSDNQGARMQSRTVKEPQTSPPELSKERSAASDVKPGQESLWKAVKEGIAGKPTSREEPIQRSTSSRVDQVRKKQAQSLMEVDAVSGQSSGRVSVVSSESSPPSVDFAERVPRVQVKSGSKHQSSSLDVGTSKKSSDVSPKSKRIGDSRESDLEPPGASHLQPLSSVSKSLENVAAVKSGSDVPRPHSSELNLDKFEPLKKTQGAPRKPESRGELSEPESKDGPRKPESRDAPKLILVTNTSVQRESEDQPLQSIPDRGPRPEKSGESIIMKTKAATVPELQRKRAEERPPSSDDKREKSPPKLPKLSTTMYIGAPKWSTLTGPLVHSFKPKEKPGPKSRIAVETLNQEPPLSRSKEHKSSSEDLAPSKSSKEPSSKYDSKALDLEARPRPSVTAVKQVNMKYKGPVEQATAQSWVDVEKETLLRRSDQPRLKRTKSIDSLDIDVLTSAECEPVQHDAAKEREEEEEEDIQFLEHITAKGWQPIFF